MFSSPQENNGRTNNTTLPITPPIRPVMAETFNVVELFIIFAAPPVVEDSDVVLVPDVDAEDVEDVGAESVAVEDEDIEDVVVIDVDAEDVEEEVVVHELHS